MAKPAQFELFSKLGLQPEKFLAPHHGPRVVATAEEFIHVTCHESHLNQVCSTSLLLSSAFSHLTAPHHLHT